MSYGYDSYRISVKTLENGFEVEIPDFEAIAKKKDLAKKGKLGSSDMPSPYIGDCIKCYAAKSVKEVLALVKGSLEKMPDGEFDSAFNDAASKY